MYEEDLPCSIRYMEEFEKLVEKMRVRGEECLGAYVARLAGNSEKDLEDLTADDLLDLALDPEDDSGDEMRDFNG